VVTTASGPASLTYAYQDCTADEMPLAPTHLTAQVGNGQLTVAFAPAWRDSGVNPDTWEYRVGSSGSWTSVDPDHNYNNDLEFVVDHLTNGTPATISVRGVSSDGVAGPAASVTGTPVQPIGAVTHLAYTVSGSVVTITWDAPVTPGTNALDGYQAFLFFNNENSGGLAFECDTAPTVRVCEAPAPPGPNYSVGVNAVDTAGNAGDPSDPIAVGKIAPPSSVPAADGTLSAPSGAGGGSVVKGHKVTLHGTGYAPNSLISVLVYSTPQVLTTTMTDASGSFTVEVTVPAGLPDGRHTLVAAGADPSGHMRYMTLPITVTAGSAELAYTGASVLTPALAGLGALVLGGGLLMVSRRRSPR
jgi:LPXTG-motif cell wall-anchored protein